MGDFYFRDLELTTLEVIQGQGHCGFRILGTEFVSVFLSNHGSMSHRLGATDPQSFCYGQRTSDRQRTDNRHAQADKGEAAHGVALKSAS